MERNICGYGETIEEVEVTWIGLMAVKMQKKEGVLDLRFTLEKEAIGL